MPKLFRHKFKATPSRIDNKHFPSKLEALAYQSLKEHQAAGRVVFFLRQPRFDLPGNARHAVDFLVFTPTDTLFIEIKGRDLAAGKLKRRQVEELYPVKIHVIKKISELNTLLQETEKGALSAPEYDC